MVEMKGTTLEDGGDGTEDSMRGLAYQSAEEDDFGRVNSRSIMVRMAQRTSEDGGDDTEEAVDGEDGREGRRGRLVGMAQSTAEDRVDGTLDSSGW